MDAINLDILKQLQEHAQKYFAAIIEVNTIGGKCVLNPGKYSAKDMQDNSYKSVFGHAYNLPEDPEFDGIIKASAGTFNCEFPYRQIFRILNDWETMSRAGKLKAVFEIGEVEEKSAKVLISEKTALGAFKTKTMKLQRIAGNWWRPAKLPKTGQVWLYHETNGVMHIGGRSFNVWDYENNMDYIIAFCEKWNDEEFIKLMTKYNPGEESEFNGYYSHVLELAGISTEEPQQTATETETAQISTQAEKVENEPTEEIKAVETPNTTETANYTTEPEKCAQEPRKQPKRVVRIFRITQRRTYKDFLMVANVPRCFTAYHFVDVNKMVYAPPGWSPPIRGDCTMRIKRHTTDFKPP